jgi:hypothetical protein
LELSELSEECALEGNDQSQGLSSATPARS